MITSQIHRDKALTELSIKYQNQAYIADKVFPIIPVKKESDEYYIFKKDARIPETIRANRALANEHTFKLTYSTYKCNEHALKDYISERDKANYDLGDINADVTETLKDKILLRREYNVASYFNVAAEASSQWTANVSLAATQAWTSQSIGADPIIITDTMATEVVSNCFMEPNTMIMPKAVKRVFKRHTSILDRIKYTSSRIDDAAIAAMTGFDNVFFPSVNYQTTPEDASTTTYTDLYADNVWIGYVSPTPGPRKMSAGYTFQMKNFGVDRWYDQERSSDVIRVSEAYDSKLVAADAGSLIVNVYS